MNPVTRFTIVTVQTSVTFPFQIVHDLDESFWSTQFDRWLEKAKNHNSDSLILWMKKKKPHCICVTKKDFDEITAGHSAPATKEEWEAERRQPAK